MSGHSKWATIKHKQAKTEYLWALEHEIDEPPWGIGEKFNALATTLLAPSLSANLAALVTMNSNGTLGTKDGSMITGNNKTTSGIYGGGVYIETGRFTKSGGTIYGDTDKTHAAGDIENTAKNSNGHAVYVSSGPKKRTAPPE
jgi:hypothetical protein